MIDSGRHGGLEYDIARPENAADGDVVAVLLHGRGSHKGDLQALGPTLPPDWTLVTPQAPYPGEPWGYGPGWAWYRYAGEDRVEEETLERSVALLDGFIAGLTEVTGLTPGRTVLGGFSQGGTMSLTFALTHPGRVAAALNFSGFLPSSVALPSTSAGATPLFWGHGRRDPNIPFHLAEKGRAALVAAGMPLVARDYSIGHWMLPEEIHDAVAMIESGA